MDAVLPKGPSKPDKNTQDRLDRGRARMREDVPRRNECLKFWRGDQYIYRDDKGLLINQATITLASGGGKPRHRVRTTRNLIKDIVAHEVAAGTTRVPTYEITPSTSEPEDIDAARISQKVAFYGYDKWNLRSVTRSAVTYAVVADEAFVWPFWDSSVGPYIDDGEGGTIGQGEVGVRIFGANEVYWEPGMKFDESRWHAVEQARPIEEVQEMEGYNGGKLQPDATAADDDGIQREKIKKQARLVLVTEYLERPSKKHQKGRWLTIANGKIIRDERPFPCQDQKGNALDEPALHMLSYFTDPDNDRDMGLVRDLLDAQRTINDATNKRLEWKNLALNPQVVIQNGEFKQQLTDEPGAVFHAVGSGQITWREVPQIPGDLQAIKDDAIADMARMAAQNDIPTNIESGKAIATLLEKDASRRADFLGNLAEWHSRLMRHCLYLVQRHYTEERQLKINGKRGPSMLSNFKGAQLRGQADVTVLPGSIAPRTRESITAQVMAFADRGWISPYAAMAAINGGTAESLVDAYEADVGRANQIIQKIQDKTFWLTPERPPFGGEDPGWEVPPEGPIDEMGQPMLDEMGQPIITKPGIRATTIPGWIPRPFDNEVVHIDVFSTWMKTPDFDALEDAQVAAANAYYSYLLDLQAKKAQREAEMQAMEAEQLGMENASKPQDKGMPDQRGGGSEAQIFGARYEAGSTQPF
jgi:hypothetical protein